MTDPVADNIGDHWASAAQQYDRLLARGIDIRPHGSATSPLRAGVAPDTHVRTLERHAVANGEEVWNGRRISLIVSAERLGVLDGQGRLAHRAHPA
jgi:hypothetical protein